MTKNKQMIVDEKSLRHLEEFKPQLERTSIRGKIGVVILLLFIILGVYALLTQIIKGHVVTGMRDNVVWGLYIVNFIFFIGISYAGALISGILHLLRVPWRAPIIRMAETITVISTLIGPSYILLCMGRLDRLDHLLLFGRIQSPITWDVIAISTFNRKYHFSISGKYSRFCITERSSGKGSQMEKSALQVLCRCIQGYSKTKNVIEQGNRPVINCYYSAGNYRTLGTGLDFWYDITSGMA